MEGHKAVRLLGQIGGSAAATGLGYLAAGPAGAMAAATIPPLFDYLTGEFLDRDLSAREKQRVAAGMELALEIINARLESEDQLRDDGFLDRDGDEQSDAATLLEGALMKCRNEYASAKLKHYAAVAANVLFESGVSASNAYYFLNTVSELTYRQLTILSLVHQSDVLDFHTLRLQRPAGELPHATVLRCEIEKLQSPGVLLLTSDERTESIGPYTSHHISKFFLSDMGTLFVKLAALEQIPRDVLAGLIEQFKE